MKERPKDVVGGIELVSKERLLEVQGCTFYLKCSTSGLSREKA